MSNSSGVYSVEGRRFGRETCQLKSMFIDKIEFCSKLSKLPRSSMGLVPGLSLEAQCPRTDVRVARVCEPSHQLCRGTGGGYSGPGERAQPALSPVISAQREKASPAAPSASDPRTPCPPSHRFRLQRGLGRPGPRCLPRDPAPAPSIPSQARPDKSSAKPFRELPPLLELSAPAGTLSSCKNGWIFLPRTVSACGDGAECERIFKRGNLLASEGL